MDFNRQECVACAGLNLKKFSFQGLSFQCRFLSSNCALGDFTARLRAAWSRITSCSRHLSKMRGVETTDSSDPTPNSRNIIETCTQ
eukprot:3341105-Amphidinium_carterae.1